MDVIGIVGRCLTVYICMSVYDDVCVDVCVAMRVGLCLCVVLICVVFYVRDTVYVYVCVY